METKEPGSNAGQDRSAKDRDARQDASPLSAKEQSQFEAILRFGRARQRVDTVAGQAFCYRVGPRENVRMIRLLIREATEARNELKAAETALDYGPGSLPFQGQSDGG